MWRGVIIALLAVAYSFGVDAQSVSTDPSLAPNGSYRLDVLHSQLLFSISHLGLTDYYGRFDKLAGTLDFDANQPERSSASVTIDMNSIDTPNERLSDTLKGADVFSVAQFPSAMFKSTSIVRTGPTTGRITGNLTFKGVTKPVVLDVVFNGGAPDPLSSAYALGFRATATIKRSDFGLTGMAWAPFVGDDVHLIIEAMFEQEKE